MQNLQKILSDDEFNDNTSSIAEIVNRIKVAVQMPIKLPYGKKGKGIEDYFSKFNEDAVSRFIDKLSQSKWVRNPSFTLDIIVRDDLVNTLGVGTCASFKYYKIETLNLSSFK